MLRLARDFFTKRGLIETDVGALVKCPPNDSNIDCIATDQDQNYLHTSPEYAMKRLLSIGVGDCYFLGHVYRKNEQGHLHSPEFTMAEWYRVGFSFEKMIEETCDFISLFLGDLPVEVISYRKAFSDFAGINYSTTSLHELQKMTQSTWDRQTCLTYLLSHVIEPKLGKSRLTVLTDYPPDEAALACTKQKDGELVAERFEIYHEGVELCNGYHELNDAIELRRRFEKKNEERQKENKEPYPIDEPFLASLKTLPDCCGVALGFDRVLMLKQKSKSIQDVLPLA